MPKLHLKGFSESIEFHSYEELLVELLSDFNLSRSFEIVFPKIDDVFDESLFIKIEQFRKYFISRIKIINTKKVIKYKSSIIEYQNEQQSVLKAVHEIDGVNLQIATWKDKVNDGSYIEYKTDDKSKNLFYLLLYELYFDYLRLNKRVLFELLNFLKNNYAQQLDSVKGSSNDSVLSTFKNVELNNEVEDNSNLLTVEQTCRLLKKGRTTVYNWEKKGFIKKHIIGGSTYYFKDEILKKIKKD